jgi:hypothetical protein
MDEEPEGIGARSMWWHALGRGPMAGAKRHDQSVIPSRDRRIRRKPRSRILPSGVAVDISRRAFVGTAASGVAMPPSARTAGRLQAQGSGLTYRGMRVRLRGVSVGDPLLARRDRPVSDYRVLARAWGCNVVRISVLPGLWRDQPSDAMRLLERDVTAALANRMWVIINWHAIGWPNGYLQVPDSAWGLPADVYDTGMDLARAFWATVADRYGYDGRIVFQLWNEPIHDPDERVAPGARWPALRSCYEDLLSAVRVRSANLALCAGDRWAYDLRGIRADPVRDGNVGYAWHVYAGADDDDPLLWTQKLDDLDRTHPVIVTEWGFCRSCVGAHYQGTPEGYGRSFMTKFLNGREMSHTGWVWHPYWSPSMILADWRTATEFGRFVASHLAHGPRPRP